MILGIVYFILSGVIIYQVISILKLSDRIEDLERSEEYRLKEYLDIKKENEKLNEIIENVKNTMSF